MERYYIVPSIALIFIYAISYSQEIKICGTIEFHQTTDLAYLHEVDYLLHFNNEESLYVEQSVNKKSSKSKTQNEGSDTTRGIIVARNNTTPYFYHYKNDNFSFREIWFDTPLTVRDNFDFKWQLLEESKLIGSFLCKRAKTTYRGRTYFAWYSSQIPYNYGPWKFRGLPGLILEVEEQDGKFHITPKKISLDALMCTIEVPQIENILTVDEFLTKRNDLNNQLLSRISSKSGKGSQPLRMEENCEGCKELKLEWYYD